MAFAHSRPSLLVSACLLGARCRYDGQAKPSARVNALAQAWVGLGGTVVPVCPEELGGLGTPRRPAELRHGDGFAVLDGTALVRTVGDDEDVTQAFVAGAKAARAQAPTATGAVLKARSPSCGVGETQVDGHLVEGFGVLAALLSREGVAVHSDEEADLAKALLP